MNLPIVLVRFNEIALKSKNTRSALRRLLRHNLLTSLEMNETPFDRIEDTWDRLIVYTDESEEVADISSKVFGVASASPADECASDIETISRVVSNIAKEKMKAGESFALRVRRVGKHEFTTNEVAVRCGSSVIESLKKDGTKIKVNLDSPDHEMFIEVRGERTFVYNIVTHGVGGLPLGSQGKIVSHLGDFESIVATWLMMKRGCMPILVLFDSQEETGELINTARSLLLPYVGSKLLVIELPLSKIIVETDSTPYLEECLKYRAMNYIAKLQSAEGIVSSKRLAPSEATQLRIVGGYAGIVDFPVFYPLVGFDGMYLRSLAERIGGKALVIKIGDEVHPRRESQDDAKFDVTCEQEYIIQHYQEKIKEEVVGAIARASV